MSVVSTMILRSMRMIGEKARGATLDSSEQTECLAEFNTFLDACAVERLLCYTVQQDSLALSVSTSTYSIGPGGAFNVTRPTRIVDPCYVRDSAGQDYPLRVVDSVVYGRIGDKSSVGTRPEYLYYDAGLSATSTATLYLYPPPSESLTLFIASWKQLGSVSTLSHNIALPPGYQLFLESNFAVHLAAGQVPISAELGRIARDSKIAIKSLNLPSVVMRMEPMPHSPRGGNILNDYVA
jgi:hypothetical protein